MMQALAPGQEALEGAPWTPSTYAPSPAACTSSGPPGRQRSLRRTQSALCGTSHSCSRGTCPFGLLFFGLLNRWLGLDLQAQLRRLSSSSPLQMTACPFRATFKHAPSSLAAADAMQQPHKQ
jgi:hypothetical protein